MDNFETLWREAHAAGIAAGNAAGPVPMVVTDGTRNWFVADGVCGFAWVKVRPATSAFARWMKRTGRADHASYTGGYDIWCGEFGQSMQRKEAYCRAFSSVLRNAGINACTQSRMD